MKQGNFKEDSESEFRLKEALEDYVSREDFSSKKRLGVPFEGVSPEQMLPEELNRLNNRWEEFYQNKKKVLDKFTGYDHDLVSIGLLSVRRMLCLYPDCSNGLLIQQAKYDIMASLRWGNSIDSHKHHEDRQDIAPIGTKYLPFSAAGDSLLEDQIQHEAGSSNGTLGRFETQLFDRIQYQEFWDSLTNTNSILKLCINVCHSE